METEPPALFINAEIPNTIHLEENQWESQPPSPFFQHMTIYVPLLIVAIWATLFTLCNAVRDSGGFVWIAVLLFSIALIFFSHHEILKRHEKKHLAYRQSKMDDLVQLFKTEGYSILEESQIALSSISRRSDFRVVTDEGIRYRCDYLEVDDNEIKARLILTDYNALERIKRAERQAKKAERIQFLTRSYESRNGEFATPELRDAFIEGLKLGSR